MLKRLFILLFFFLTGMASLAQTILSDSILMNTRLIIQDSPYYIVQDLVIDEGITLEVDAGVQLIIADATSIRNNGRFIIQGTEKQTVLFTTESENERWGYINNNGTVIAKHLFVRNATRFISSLGDTVIVDYCNVSNTFGTIGDDCIGVHDAKKVLVLNSFFEGNPESGKTDALDLDRVGNDTVAGNFIWRFSDDGIDIGTGSDNMVVVDNVISECDIAISIGESSTALVSGNLLSNCVAGIQSHYGSVVTAQHNTLYGNIQGLRAFHNSSEETSGGTLHISNSIISNCTKNVLVVKENSLVSIQYCITDSLLMDGPGNITGLPLFVDAEGKDFKLRPTSPAIDAGNPDSDGDGQDYTTDSDDRDRDGSRLDMGCFPYYHSSLRLIEISPSNLSMFADDSGSFTDWIRICNLSDSMVNLKNYYLSDNREKPTKHQLKEDLFLAAWDTIIFWADNFSTPLANHLSFQLSGDGEYVSLSNPEGIVIDEKVFGRVPVNFLYRRIGSSEEWEFVEWPLRDTSKTYRELSAVPVFSQVGGEMDFPLDLEIHSPKAGDSIYYSEDGSDPMGGSLFQDTLDISLPLTIRALSAQTNNLPSYPYTASFYPKASYHLPLMSVSTNEENLYGETGIYTNYSKGDSFWERPACVSYYDGNNTFSAITGLKIQGGNSVWMPKKSFRFHFRGGYGTSRLEASPFSSGPTSFKNLVIRSGYDDDISGTTGTMLRDPFSTDLWERLGELATKSSWSVMLLNNNYWGIYNIRESINEYFVADHLGREDFDLVRFQKWGPDLKYGAWDEWNNLLAFFDSTDFSRPSAYDEVAEFMDLNSLLNMLALVHCTQFRSWTWGAFAIKPAMGKWRWTIWDTDRSYSTLGWNGFTEYAYTSAEKWPNFIPQKLILNERFQQDLINRNCDLMNALLLPENAISIYDSLVAIIEPEMDAEYERWSPGNRSRWEVNNEGIRDFLRDRPAYLYNQMKAYFGIEDTSRITVQIIGNGKVKLNSLLLEDEEWSGIYMNGIPVSLEAQPGAGATFIEWRNLSNKHTISVDPADKLTIVAVFDTVSISQTQNLVLNEIMYNPADINSSEWIEFYNPNEFSVSMEGFSLSDGGIGNRFVFPKASIIDPKDYIVLAGDLSAYAAEFGIEKTINGSFNYGISGFQLSNGGETISLTNKEGELLDQVHYLDRAPWPVFADGVGPSLQLKGTEMENSLPENWFADILDMYTPGEENRAYNSREIRNAAPGLKVYPNPFSQALFIELNQETEPILRVQLLSVSGKILSTVDFQNPDPGEAVVFNHGLTQSGMYLLKLSGLKNGASGVETRLVIFGGK